jgi:hypothetical protein
MHVQLLRGARYMALMRDGDEVTKVAQFHVYIQ